jgi:hypothetical protein
MSSDSANRHLHYAHMVMRSAKPLMQEGSTEATGSDAAVFERPHRAQTPVFGRHMHSCSGFRSENRRTGALTVVSLLLSLLSMQAVRGACIHVHDRPGPLAGDKRSSIIIIIVNGMEDLMIARPPPRLEATSMPIKCYWLVL